MRNERLGAHLHQSLDGIPPTEFDAQVERFHQGRVDVRCAVGIAIVLSGRAGSTDKGLEAGQAPHQFLA